MLRLAPFQKGMARGTYGGVDFKDLRSLFTTKTELLSQFINKQVMLRRPEFCYQFHNTAHGRLSLVTIRSVVSCDHTKRSSTCKSQHNLPLPTDSSWRNWSGGSGITFSMLILQKSTNQLSIMRALSKSYMEIWLLWDLIQYKPTQLFIQWQTWSCNQCADPKLN